MAFARQAYALDSNDHAANNNIALAARELGDTTTALQAHQRNLRLEPKNAVGWMNYGFLLASLDRHTEALEHYAEAEKLGYDTAALHNNIGHSLMRTGDLVKARAAIERSLKKDGTNAYAHRNLALLALEQGDADTACDALEKALAWGFTKTYGNEVVELRKEHCK
jgi:Flp pilus assembly protein TadD